MKIQVFEKTELALSRCRNEPDKSRLWERTTRHANGERQWQKGGILLIMDEKQNLAITLRAIPQVKNYYLACLTTETSRS